MIHARLIRPLSGALALGAVLALSPAPAGESPTSADWKRIKREWARLSPSERAAYTSLVRARVAAIRRGPASAAAAESCASAAEEVTALPFTDTGDTTGAADDLNLAAAGSCAGGGNQFAQTGNGPDLVYALRTDQSCDLQLTLTPTAVSPMENDLALYVILDCANQAASCIAVEDTGVAGESESITFSATGTLLYYVVVDGWNGDAGPFRLDVAESGSTGCMLVPVEVQSFSVE